MSTSRRQRTRESLYGTLFVSPWLLGFVLLFLWPFAASFYWSFCQFNLIDRPQWIGWENYQRLANEIGTSQGFGNALTNTVYYALLAVPLSVIAGVLLALLLSTSIKGQAVYRTLVFLPSVIPVVAASVLWIWLLDPENGMVNYAFSWVGIPSQNWLHQSRSGLSLESWNRLVAAGQFSLAKLLGSKDALVLMSVWGVGNFVVIYLAALSDIPQSLYEAASIDGAGAWRQSIHVTLPMLSPVIFFNLVMGLIRTVQEFTSIYILSEGVGEPGGSLIMLSLQLFLTGFDDMELGYASAMAWLLFLVLVAATGMLFRTSRYWVHYRMVQ